MVFFGSYIESGKNFSKKSRQTLNKPFRSKEIRKAILLTPNKAPGPSGVRISLFKTFIVHFSTILKDIANEAMEKGVTSEFLMKGIITLIPKKENSNKINDLRPITLLEIPRKIITKAMTSRIKKVLLKDNLINEYQFSHPGRLIHDNVHTLNLLIEKAKNCSTNLHAMFLDCMKAFDMVSFDHIKNSLLKRNCGNNFWNFISTFLGGEAKVKFNNKLSKSFKIGRGTPQGETLSPFLFIFTINPLLNAIINDNNIKGIKVGNSRIKIMAYADDLVLISDNREDLERMLEHVRNYEKASNAKLNEKKSQILSFGNEIIEEINGIKQCDKEDKVRHLGFYFNRNGLINNIDDIIENIHKKLKILKNLFPNFTTRINIWKGYAISSLLYQSEVITIEEKQIEIFEKLEKYFLFEKEINGDLKEMERINSSISLERLEQPKKYGGYNLKKILEIFSASKAKTLMRAMNNRSNLKPWNYLLLEKCSKLYDKQSKLNTAHPLFTTDERNVKLEKRVWKWFEQANIVYCEIDKDLTFYPNVGDTVFDWHNEKIINIENESEKREYKPINKTIPIVLTEKGMEKYQLSKEIRRRKLYEMELNKINKNEKIKTRNSVWMKRVKVEFIGFKKDEKISLNKIFKNKISNRKLKPKWTRKQTKWIRRGVQLEKLLSMKIKTIPKIEDFRRKFLMNFWYKMRFHKCPLCKNKNIKFNAEHLLLECDKVKDWEITTYGNRKRKKRIEAFWNCEDPNYLASWIFNWSIWNNVWDIKFEKLPHLKHKKFHQKNFKRYLENNEFVHNKMILEKRRDLELNKVKYQIETNLFHFSKLKIFEENNNN